LWYGRSAMVFMMIAGNQIFLTLLKWGELVRQSPNGDGAQQGELLDVNVVCYRHLQHSTCLSGEPRHRVININANVG